MTHLGTKMSSVSAQRRKRIKKEDPERYAEFLKKEKERTKKYRHKKVNSGTVVDLSVYNITLGSDFLEKVGETYERYLFNTRNQKADETVEDYIAALHTLASTCNFCDCLKDSLLRDRIVLGIKDGSTRKRLLQEADLNLETCIAMCRAAEAASPSRPLKTVTGTEDTTAVQAGSGSSGDQRPGKKRDFFPGLKLRRRRRCDPVPVAPPDELEIDDVETSEVDFKTEMDDSDDDSSLQWTTELDGSDFPRTRTEHKKQESAWSMEEDSPDQPYAVCKSTQPMSDNTSGSLNTSHECYHCSAAFVLVSSLELHLASVHGDKLLMVWPESFTPDRYGDCSDTDTMDKVDSHDDRKRTSNEIDNEIGGKDEAKMRKRHMCDVCRKSYFKNSDLKRHKLTHSGVKPFVCDVCSKRFYEGSQLNRHKLTHNNHKPFLCDVCSKSFTEAGSLKSHKRVHTREKPYKCAHCDSSFKQLGNLQRHVKSVHEGAKPHLCDVCGAAFSLAYDLVSHRNVHTGAKPHVCPHCGKGFATFSSLARHRLTHTGQKPHRCSHCPGAFRRLEHLKAHIQRKHR